MADKVPTPEHLAEPTPADVEARLSLDARGLTKRVDGWHGPVSDRLGHDLDQLAKAIAALLAGDPNPDLDYAPFSGRRIPGEPGRTRTAGGTPPS